MTYVIAFNFEFFGPIPTIHGFTQLGAVIGNLASGHIIDTFSEYANQADYASDKNCIETFWLKNPDRYKETLKKCNQSTKHPQDVIELFIRWIDKFVEKRGQSVYLITDYSTYDSGILKAFSLINKYPIIDTTSYFLGVSRLFMTDDIVNGSSFELAHKALNLPEFKSVSKSNHSSINKATVIFEKYKFINDGLINN